VDRLHGNAAPPISSQREFWNQWNVQYRTSGFGLPAVNAREAETIQCLRIYEWTSASTGSKND